MIISILTVLAVITYYNGLNYILAMHPVIRIYNKEIEGLLVPFLVTTDSV